MIVTDGRTKHRKQVRKDNVSRVKKFFDNNSSGTVMECSKRLNLSRTTIHDILNVELKDV